MSFNLDNRIAIPLRHLVHTLFLLVLGGLVSGAFAQSLPQLGGPSPNPRADEIRQIACPVDEIPADASQVWIEEYERRARYGETLPAYFAAVPLERDQTLKMPIEGVTVGQIVDTWGAARSEGRRHEGQDIFVPRGTPIYSATTGYVYRMAENPRGGNTVTVVGGGGVRYYYAHLNGYPENLEEGQYVTTETVIGFVGNTGNARTTPPHLHIGMYTGSYESCDWEAENPYPLLVNR